MPAPDRLVVIAIDGPAASGKSSTALAALEAHRLDVGHRAIVDLFREDSNRFERFSVRLDDLIFDYSKHRVTDATLAHLLSLARAVKNGVEVVAEINGRANTLRGFVP